MRKAEITLGVWSAVCVLLLLSCGQGAQEGGGIGGTGIVASVAAGPVTSTETVGVSGASYETTATTFVIDGQTATNQDALRKGMVVLVEAAHLEEAATGRVLKRSAERISYSDTVEGTIDAVDPTGKSFTVLGQTVLLTDTTIVDASVPLRDVRNLVPNRDVVEVSGFVTGDGAVVATLIGQKVGAPDYEVQGIVKTHDGQSNTFKIGRLTVSYAEADIGGMPAPFPNAWEGLPVDVRGVEFMPANPSTSGGVLRASKIVLHTFGVSGSRRAEVEGIISRVIGPTSFVVGQFLVQYDDITAIEGGVATDISVGARVVVDGRLTDNIVRASRVELNDRIKLESDLEVVATPDGVSGTLSLSGLAGTVVHITPGTLFKGENVPNGLGALTVGDHLVIRGEQFGLEVLATDVIRRGPSATVVLQGPLRAHNGSILQILGSSVDTSLLPDSGFRNVSDIPIGRTAFFSALAPGTIVELEGIRQGGIIQWQEAEIQE